MPNIFSRSITAGGRVLTLVSFVIFGLVLAACESTKPAQSSSRLTAAALPNLDDGSQLANPFRINYAGYLPLQQKIALFMSSDKTPIKWQLLNAKGEVLTQGKSKRFYQNDHASGDSFFRIDFSHFTTPGDGYFLAVGEHTSHPFALSNDPYGDLKLDVYGYFKSHRREGDVFSRSVKDWTNHQLTMNFIADAGDQGYYPVNAAEAKWSLINLLESYPAINTYYSDKRAGMSSVFDELVFFASPMYQLIFPGEKLAVAKLHTNSNDTWAKCTETTGKGSSCISMPETKATYSVARSLGAMARLHTRYGSAEDAALAYQHAYNALRNAETEDFVCLGPDSFGGEGGYYPNNDNWGLWRDPQGDRTPCASGPEFDPRDDNVNDDHYAALVEVYLAAITLGHEKDAAALKSKILTHNHHQRVSQFFWGAVSTEATLSLLTLKPAGIDLTQAEKNLFHYAEQVLVHQEVGYPGITFDVKSDKWDAADQNDVDNNFRWGSNRMQLNDARILMRAADISHARGKHSAAVRYTNGVLRVLDQMFGTNGVALAMLTAPDYPHIEHAVQRTHDALVDDKNSGKFVLGPNNWTNANDPAMPKFGSQPGMKMFALTETGWSSREISIDANASLVPVMYFATEIAPTYLQAAHKK